MSSYNEPFKPTGGIEPFKPKGGIEPFKKGPRKEPFAQGSSDEPFDDLSAPAAMLADALNTATAAVVRLTDANARMQPAGAGNPLWQRDDWVRASLAQHELFSGLRHAHQSLWLLPPLAKNGSTATATRLLTLKAPTQATLIAQLRQVLARKDERPERGSEIIVQIADFWPFWTAITGVDPARAPRTYELMQLAASLSPALGQCFKHALNAPRPGQLSAVVQPVIVAPGHASYPSGHATGAFIFVHVWQALLKRADNDPMMVQLTRMAQRIADNRVVAGVHYPMDGEAGKALARVLSQYFVACALGASVTTAATFNPNETAPPSTSKVRVKTTPVVAKMFAQARLELGVSR